MNVNELAHYGVPGMKWGVRRYQNKDGTLTSAGQKRYERDQRENAARKKDNRIDVSSPDPHRWVKEDLERSRKVVDSSSEGLKKIQDIERRSRTKALDLSKMSDKELRDRINRQQLEEQYNKLFSEIPPAEVSKGRQFFTESMATLGTVLSVAGSALAIAESVKKLTGGN